MSAPRRLLEEGGSDFERYLLRSARQDAPSPELRPKTLAALGLGAGVAGAGATAAAHGAPTVLLKWIALGGMSGLLVVTAAGVLPSIGAPPARPAAIEEPAKKPVPRLPSPHAPPDPPSPVVPADLPSPVVPAAPSPVAGAPATGDKKAAAPHRQGSPAPERSALTDEIAALDAARAAFEAGDAARAIAALDRHDRDFPKALLGPEATVLRIEALALRGDHASAARLGNAFLAADPRSPHARRVRSLIGAAGFAVTPRAP